MRNCASSCRDMRARIAPNQIGRNGQLQEWLEDVDDPKNRHRHVSHLWGVASRATRSRRGRHRSWPQRAARRCGSAATAARAGARPGRSTSGPACTTATTPTKCWPRRSPATRIPTCSTPIRRSRSTATSAARAASSRCCCSRTSATPMATTKSSCCRRVPRPVARR